MTYFYYEFEGWHKEKMRYDEALKYHTDIFNSGNCITVRDGELLVGYLEFYLEGEECYIKNMYIREEYRNGETIKMLKKRLFDVAKDCTLFKGERNYNGEREWEAINRKAPRQ